MLRMEFLAIYTKLHLVCHKHLVYALLCHLFL